jgi:hypothetical protein
MKRLIFGIATLVLLGACVYATFSPIAPTGSGIGLALLAIIFAHGAAD